MSEDTNQPEKSKSELFNDNPDRFIDQQECLVIARRNPETKRIMILNQCQSMEETFVTEGYLKSSFDMTRAQISMAIAKKNKSSIIQANGKNPGYKGGLKNMFRK